MRLRHRGWRWPGRAGALVLVALALASLPACGTAPGPGASFAAATRPAGAPERGRPPLATVSPDYKELAFAEITQTANAVRTEVAGNPPPTWTPEQLVVGPSATPELGMSLGCVNATSYEPQFVTCWVGVYGGRIVNVWSGREGRDGDPAQGVVLVHPRGLADTQLVRAPQRVGALQITSVEGTLFTLTTVDHSPAITYTFDLATRAWVTPGPSPVPSAAISPVPSVSPVATQAP